MHRGTIYLTCPGDIIRMAGRDDVVLAGNSAIIKGNKGTVELEGKSVSAVSEGNLQLLAGASGKAGTLLIENKSRSAMDFSKYGDEAEFNRGFGGGVLIKGKTVATLSPDIFTGGEKFSDSRITMRAATMVSVFRDAVSYIQGGSFAVISKKAAFTVNSYGRVDMLASRVGVNASTLQCHSDKINVLFRNENGEESTATVSNSPAQLLVQKSIQARTIGAATVAGNKGSVGKNGVFDEEAFGKIFEKDVPGERLEDASSYPAVETMETKTGVDSVEAVGTVLPKYRYSRLRLPQARWQDMITGGSKWSPVKVLGSFGRDDGMAYPGKEWMEEEGSLKKLVDGTTVNQKLSTDLTISVGE